MSDARQRELERAAQAGDDDALLALYHHRIRTGDLADKTLRRLVSRCQVPDGTADPGALEVLGWIESGELSHGSWVKLRDSKRRDGIRRHTDGQWYVVLYWYTGWAHFTVPDARWLGHYSVLRTGLARMRARRGYNKYSTGSGMVRNAVLHPSTASAGFRWLVDNVVETYRPGVGLAIFEKQRELASAKRSLAAIKRGTRGAIGPAPLLRRQAAQARVSALAIELNKLQGE